MLKHLDLASDWTMRASGSLRGAPLELWERGILDRLPDCLNQPIVGASREDGTGHGAIRRLRGADARCQPVARAGRR